MTASHVDILIGPAGSGKTERLLQDYRDALRRDVERCEPGSTLWLAPTFRACRQIQARITNAALPVCFAPNVLTFDEFAERVLQASEQTTKAMSDVAKRALLRRIIDRFRDAGKLNYFNSIAGTPGFLDLVGRFISELKREEIWPERFLESCAARGQSEEQRRKDRELALIYREYQDALLRLGMYDAEGRFWSAREEISKGGRAPFDRLTLAVADGFTDFTHTQYEILALMARWADRIAISLPLEPGGARGDLFYKSAEALARIQTFAEQGTVVRVHECCGTQAALPAFTHLAAHLFGNLRHIQPLPTAEGMTILPVTGQLGEVESLATRIKELLNHGVDPSDIVVAFPAVDDYAAIIQDVFTAAGVPHWCEANTPLLQTPVVKALITVLQLELEDWPFDRLMGVLNSNYFRPDWEGWEQRCAARCVAADLRAWKLHSDRELILRSLKRRAEQFLEKSAANEAVAAASSALTFAETPLLAYETLNRLSQAMHRLRGRSDLAGWADRLVSLARDLGITSAAGVAADSSADPLHQHDRQAWQRFERIIFDAVRADELLEPRSNSLDLAEFTHWLDDLLRTQSLPPVGSELGRVRVLNAEQVRNLEVPHLFLGGLTESNFPRRRVDDCLYGEADRQELNSHGLQLGHRAAHNRDEMLLFYGVITRARQSLTLSYPAVSSGGEPLFPSPYVTAVRELFESGALEANAVADLDPVPPPYRLITASDLRLTAILAALEGRPELFRRLCASPATQHVSRCILSAVDRAVDRYKSMGFTASEGIVSSEENLRWLAEKFHSQYEFSASQLEGFATCGYRFAIDNVLKIRPLESPEVATDYRRRGSIMHRVLAALHRELSTADHTSHWTPEQIEERVCQLLEDDLGRRVPDGKLQQALVSIEMELLSEWAAAYANQWEQYQDKFGRLWETPPQPQLMEFAFGNVPDEEEQAADKTWPSVPFGPSPHTLVQGRVDRVDVGTAGGRTVFNVVDYKTGSQLPRFNEADVQAGRALQLALYTLAIRRMGLLGEDAVPFQMGYWGLKLTGFETGLKTRKKVDQLEMEVLAALERQLDEVVPRLAEGIRTGEFPVFNADRSCTGWCEFSTVCRVNQIRPLEDKLRKQREQATGSAE